MSVLETRREAQTKVRRLGSSSWGQRIQI